MNDARLVVLNARDAANRGASIRTERKSSALAATGTCGRSRWRTFPGRVSEEVRARVLVNAAGPGSTGVLSGAVGQNAVHNVRLVQGSHIVVTKKFDDPRAYFFQNRDGRIIFAIPYEDDFTLIGTTDQDFVGDPGDVRITEGEIDYLCNAASEYFLQPVKRSDIVWTYSGVRPLYDDGASKAQEATRDYVLKTEANGGAPVINVFGGKITTYRRLAESMIEKIEEHLGRRGKSWTADAPLPGGDFPATGFEAQASGLRSAYPFLDAAMARRLTRLYGTCATVLLRVCNLALPILVDISERTSTNWRFAISWLMNGADGGGCVVASHQGRPSLSREQVLALDEFMKGVRGERAAAE